MSRCIPGENDLLTCNPVIASQWHPTKNGEVSPVAVSHKSNKKYWWICELSHDWQAPPNRRVSGSICPYCSGRHTLAGFNDIATTHPVIAAQWHPNLNGDKLPTSFSIGTHERIWWLCESNHEWEAVIYSRKTGGCPYCSGARVISGETDLLTLYPEIAEDWHPTKNDDLDPSQVLPQINVKIWWQCKRGHEWQAMPSKRTQRNDGCPTCGNRQVLKGFNDLATTNPELAKQWHPTKNLVLTPETVTSGANKKVWWKCSKGHEWMATVNERNTGKGCGVCANQVLLVGYNDLLTLYPELCKQWHPVKNGNLLPQHVVGGTNKSVWWICSDGHEWKAAIASRSGGGKGCRFCAGQEAIAGVNDLMTENPALAAQWNHQKNGPEYLPSMVRPGSNKYAWWICSEGHEWKAVIASRNKGCGCFRCSGSGTSKCQQEIHEALLPYIGDLLCDERLDIKFKGSKSMSLDMVSENLKLVIEYDGYFYHSGERSGKPLQRHLDHDRDKTQALVDIGYKVIRIREHDKGRQLPFIPFTSEYESSVFQITHKSFGKDRDSIKDLTQRIIEEKKNWFRVSR
jgi:very-short-patch-repair endonuclease